MSSRRRLDRLGFPALGAGIVGCCAAIAALGDLHAHLVAFAVLFEVAFVAYLGAIVLVARQWRAWRGRRLGLLLGVGLVCRLILLPAAPTLSDDLYRYAWEGRVLAAGWSPYRYAPADPALVALRDGAIWSHVNNVDVPSPYPPVAQMGGLLGAALTPHSTLGVKLVATIADLATIGALLLLLRALGRPPAAVLVYAWHPLVLIAFSHSGHNDSLMVAPLTLAVALAAGHQVRPNGPDAGRRAKDESRPIIRPSPFVLRRQFAPAALIALAALAKVTPLLIVPLLWRRGGVWAWLVAGVLFALVWAPFLWLGAGATGSIATYLGQWADNDSVHAVLRLVLGAAGAKATSLLLLAGGIALVALHPRLRDRPLWWQTYIVLALSIVLSSTVHAWYLTWLLPFLAVQLVPADGTEPAVAAAGPARGGVTFAGAGWRGWLPLPLPAAAWLLCSGLVALTYLTYDTHEWRLWISFAEYVPLYALLAASALLSGAAARAAAASRRQAALVVDGGYLAAEPVLPD